MARRTTSVPAGRTALVTAADDTCRRGLVVQGQRALPARHRQIDFEQQVGVEQRTVQVAVRIVDRIALAQRVEAVALARVHLAREGKRVEHAADVARRHLLLEHALRGEHRQFRIHERDVERRVVDDQLGVGHELTQLVEDVGEARLAAEEFGREAVHLHRTRIDGAIRTQVTVELPARSPPVHELDRADLDDAVTELRLEAGGFGVEDDLAHRAEGVGRAGREQEVCSSVAQATA